MAGNLAELGTDDKLLHVRQLGLCDYENVWRAMQAFTADRSVDTPDEIWFLEHSPVFTLGLNGKKEHLLAPGNIPVIQSDRGGQVTYHGPGQLLMYLLLDIQRLGIGVHQLVRLMESTLIGWLDDQGITACAKPDAPGVYVEGAKLASLGLRVKRGRCYHGLSLNVCMDLEPFSRINPCGYIDMPVTRLSDLGVEPPMPAISLDLQSHLVRSLGYTGTSGE